LYRSTHHRTHTTTSTERRPSGSNIRHNSSHNSSRGIPLFLAKSQSDSNNKNGVAAGAALKRVPPELEGIPIPFVAAAPASSSSSSSATTESSDGNTLRFIECYADCICTLNGEEYTIAVPCDYSVALCYYDGSGKQQLIPVEPADTATMDDLFPVAEAIVADEFGEELVLQRTPQTLTLVGELEDDEDEDDEEEEDDDDDADGEEEVEVLLSFEHRGKEFLLVRLLDPILLVGKKPTKALLEGNDNNDDDKEEVTMDMRVLLTPDEADRVMPQLEELFLKFHNDGFYDDDDEEEDDDDDDYPDDITIVQAP